MWYKNIYHTAENEKNMQQEAMKISDIRPVQKNIST